MSKNAPLIGKDGYKLAVITPSLLCNYDCSYCRVKSKTRASDEREMEEWLVALSSIGAPIVHVAGGEPTVLPGYEEFVLAYPGLLRMSTNLSKEPSRVSPLFWSKFDYLTLSFHPEYMTFDRFKERAKYIYDIFSDNREAPRMACTIVAHPKFLGDIEGWITGLRSVGVNARGQYFNAPAGSELKTYSDDQLSVIQRMGIPMSSSNAGQAEIESPTLKLCDAGMYYTHINRKGDARRCSRDQMELGNIFDGTFSWLNGEEQCSIPCTEACDHSFARFSVIKSLKKSSAPPAPLQYDELLVNKISDDQDLGWAGNGISSVDIKNNTLTIRRNGGAIEKQCVQRVKTVRSRIYEFRTTILNATHECIIRVNGSSLWKGRRGRVKLVFTAATDSCVIEILPSAHWHAEVEITLPSISFSVPSSL